MGIFPRVWAEYGRHATDARRAVDRRDGGGSDGGGRRERWRWRYRSPAWLACLPCQRQRPAALPLQKGAINVTHFHALQALAACAAATLATSPRQYQPWAPPQTELRWWPPGGKLVFCSARFLPSREAGGAPAPDPGKDFSRVIKCPCPVQSLYKRRRLNRRRHIQPSVVLFDHRFASPITRTASRSRLSSAMMLRNMPSK